ncbi:MAG: DNA polymerase III subunit gamma/tau [Bdellovibrionales bacterium]|nr:DNA polymerase III subunit gamma/tau [Bdellovibrionales bacterium]
MSYQVLARKWRPQNFEELIGQNSASQTLKNALKTNRLYPVLLFTGPRGTGKTSTARIVAKSLRCPYKKEDLLPCQKCDDCIFISNSRHLDVIEIDGASNNGVDAIRDLRDKISYMPSTGYWKIYIIDEVHMLSQSAFNALLKTLEEPPKHVVFIMATTESHKIPVTVLSRCQKIDFHLLSTPIIKEHLKKICEKEDFFLSENILWTIAKQAQGSLRDAQSLLDQIVTFCGKDSKESEVMKLLGLSDPQILEDCLKALINQEEEKIISLISDLRSKNFSPKIFLQQLIENFSQLLFLKKNPTNKPPLVHGWQEEIDRKKNLISSFSYEQLHFLFDMLLKGEREMNLCYDSELVLEVLLLRMCSAPQIESLVPFPFVKPNLNSLEKNSNLNPKKEDSTVSKQKNKSSDKTKEPTKLKLKPFDRRFDFLDYLKKKDSLLSSHIENLSIKKKTDFVFVLLIPENFPYLKKKLEDPLFQKKLEQEFNNFLKPSQKAHLEYHFKYPLEKTLQQEKEQKNKEELFKEAQKDPLVQQTQNIFNATIKSTKKIDKENKDF